MGGGKMQIPMRSSFVIDELRFDDVALVSLQDRVEQPLRLTVVLSELVGQVQPESESSAVIHGYRTKRRCHTERCQHHHAMTISFHQLHVGLPPEIGSPLVPVQSEPCSHHRL